VQDKLRLPEVPGAPGLFLQRLTPFPSAGTVEPASLLPMLLQRGPAAANPVQEAAAPVSEPVASIVSQAASVLDEEMAKGVLAARGGATNQGDTSAAHPVLQQMQDFVQNLAALWPNLQEGVAPAVPAAPQPAAASGHVEPLARLKPRASVKPGERTTISMTLRNSESQPVRLVPVATDLLGARGGRIAGSLLEFMPSEMALAPQEQKELVISATIPVDTAPGCYSGLLVARGLDYLRALVTIEVAGNAAASAPLTSPPHAAVPDRVPDAFSMPRTRLGSADGGSMMQEALHLARDGELGNSDAIRLLQTQRRPEDIREVLARFDHQLTPEARSKLTLAAFAPLPEGVDNQRYEPIFDRHPISGKTYTTAAGTVVLNEVQYYNGEMVQIHGVCPNVAAVREALAGSGYKPMTMKHPDGRESAIVQFWSHQLSDTSLRPYNAMFLIVVAVSDDTPAAQACIRGDGSGAASVLPMLDGRHDPGRRSYENRASLYFVRLLDSTRVAIDVGRERMGTDKRPGTIDLTRNGPQRTFSVRDGAGHAVARISFTPAGDPGAFAAELARAAGTAGIALRELPRGTARIYPGVARIGNGPVSVWQWRSDVTPRFQSVQPDTAAFDASSEEGQTLIRWGFEPKVLGYIPNVRGVITGIP